MTKAITLISLVEQDFEYRTLDDLLNTIKRLEPGEYNLSGVESVMVSSKRRVSLDSVQAFITRYNKVCYISLEGYSSGAKDLILMSDEPKRVGKTQTMKDSGAVVSKNRLFAYNLQ